MPPFDLTHSEAGRLETERAAKRVSIIEVTDELEIGRDEGGLYIGIDDSEFFDTVVLRLFRKGLEKLRDAITQLLEGEKQ